MSASGKKEDMSEAEITQRQEASLKHGAIAFKERGEAALKPEQRGAYAILHDQLSSGEGTVEALKEQAAQTMMLAQIAQAYVIQEYKKGKTLDSIPLLNRLPLFWNSANRCMRNYYDVLHFTRLPNAELDHIQAVFDEYEEDGDEAEDDS
jgi:hypothetical protein